MMMMANLNGTFIAYRPQWKDGDVWRDIAYKQLFGNAAIPARGFHFPLLFGGICQEVWLCGEAQAWAIAWTFAAEYEAVKPGSIEVRIQPYDVSFKIDYSPKLENDDGKTT